MSTTTRALLENIAIIVIVVIAMIAILKYIIFAGHDFKVGDEFIDKRWGQHKLVILEFAKDGSGLIRVQKSNVAAQKVIIEVTASTLYEYYTKIEK